MSWRTSNLSDLILDNEVPNFQIFFGDEKVLEDFGKSAKELEKKFFKSNGGAWREFPDLVEAEFLKVNLLSEDFMAFRFPKLSEKIFIGREENYKDYKRFRVLQIGYFDVSQPFYKEEFFVQVASDSIQNYMGNNKYFDETVWKKWKETESFKIGKERVLDQNEVRKVSQENRFLKEQLEKFQNNLEKMKFQKEFSEIEKLEKELESLKSFQPKTETQRKQQEEKEGFYIWNGKEIQDFGISANTFKEFKDKILKNILKEENRQKSILKKELDSKLPPEKANFSEKLEPKDDEFETENEFQQRKAKFELQKKQFELNYKKERNKQISQNLERVQKISLKRPTGLEFLNSYLGSQKVEMKYNPEKGLFDVKYSNKFFDGSFQIEIPRNIAREFKSKVKNFDFHFSKNLVLENVSVQFQNRTYFGKGFNKDILEEIERERLEREILNILERERLERERLERERLERERLKREREIASKTVSVGNLMFQDFDLPQRMNWQDSCDYCEKLKLLGFNNWRLPNKKELKTAQNNKNRFKNLQSKTSRYWSISKYDISKSRFVLFDSGYDLWSSQADSNFAVCVRDL
jgi:hypothetical protein